MRDMHSDVVAVKALTPQVATADAAATDIDLSGFEAAEVLFHIGASGDTLSGTVKMALALAHSDDGTTYTAVAAADLTNGTPDANGVVATIDSAAEDDVIHAFGYIGGKQYIQATVDFTGTHTNGTPIAITVLKSKARNAPVQ